MEKENANYVVMEVNTRAVANFYSTQLPKALIFAGDCVRHMKSLTGKSYEIAVKVDGIDYYLTVEDYQKNLTA